MFQYDQRTYIREYHLMMAVVIHIIESQVPQAISVLHQINKISHTSIVCAVKRKSAHMLVSQQHAF